MSSPYGFNLLEEQRKDLNLFRRYGVSEDFLEVMFQQPAEEMWYPPEQLLIDMGIFDEILD